MDWFYTCTSLIPRAVKGGLEWTGFIHVTLQFQGHLKVDWAGLVLDMYLQDFVNGLIHRVLFHTRQCCQASQESQHGLHVCSELGVIYQEIPRMKQGIPDFQQLK